MFRFASHDEAGPWWPVVQGDQVGDFGDGGTLAGLAVLVAGGCPPLVIDLDLCDRTVNLGVFAGHDREPNITGPASRDERVGASRRIGTDHDRPRDEARIVAGMVASGVTFGELTNRSVEDRQMVLGESSPGMRWVG